VIAACLSVYGLCRGSEIGGRQIEFEIGVTNPTTERMREGEGEGEEGTKW
jgi:hypothetical protein